MSAQTGRKCLRQNLVFSIGLATKISIFKLRPLFRFLCLINPFYRRYASCMYNISKISNKYPIYLIYPIDISMHFEFFSGRTRPKSPWEAQDINVPTPIIPKYIEIHRNTKNIYDINTIHTK